MILPPTPLHSPEFPIQIIPHLTSSSRSFSDPHGPLIPIFGTIPAGLPADQHQEPEGFLSINLDSLHLPTGPRIFALKVRGDSMNGAGILPGDIVIFEFKNPLSGDIVAALIDGQTTLKRYLIQRGKPFLQAENPRFPNLIPAHELVIQGVQIALWRVLKRSS